MSRALLVLVACALSRAAGAAPKSVTNPCSPGSYITIDNVASGDSFYTSEAWCGSGIQEYW